MFPASHSHGHTRTQTYTPTHILLMGLQLWNEIRGPGTFHLASLEQESHRNELQTELSAETPYTHGDSLSCLGSICPSIHTSKMEL